MAKRNSTKTATKEAMQASEPRFQMMSKWQGINLAELASNWDRIDNDNDQTDLPMNFLHVQNNVETTEQLTLETREHELDIFTLPEELVNYQLTGVSYMKGKYLFLGLKHKNEDLWRIVAHDVTDEDDTSYESVLINFEKPDEDNPGSFVVEESYDVHFKFTYIYSYLDNEEDHLIALGYEAGTTNCSTFVGPLSEIFDDEGGLFNSAEIEAPQSPAVLQAYQVAPWQNIHDFWDVLIYMSYEYPVKDDQGVDHNMKLSTYGGFINHDDVADHSAAIFENDKWYIDEQAYMYYKHAETIYTFNFPNNDEQEEPTATDLANIAAFYSAYWDKKLYIDRTAFDRAWVYKQYNDPSIAPSSVFPNTWRTDPSDSNLTNDVLISKWAKTPTKNQVTLNVTDPDNNYTQAYDHLKPDTGEFSTDYVTYFIATNGDLWLLVNYARGNTGGDTLLLQANGPVIPTRDNITTRGSVTVSNVNFYYAYANKFGQTTLSTGDNILTFDALVGPATWSDMQYVTLWFHDLPSNQDIRKINIYFTLDDAEDPSFVGSIDIDPENPQAYYSYRWLGSTAETAEWSNQNLTPDSINTTKGPDARFCRMHDGRLYFWGSLAKPYRLFIGGNPGHELNMARGYGGAWIDIEPGIGTIVTGTYKWKTQSGASIVTILCGNENTSTNKRFNLVENNITVDNELAEKSYMVEEIANTVGCPSHWGAGVWQDGFYVLNRYGLTLTTMQMEYVSQMQSQLISQNVQPLFTDHMGIMIDNARMIYVDEHIYICFGTGSYDEADADRHLDRVILCYSLTEKAWYTYTYGDENTDILHIMNIDYRNYIEGIGIICANHVGMIPTTGSYDIVEDNMVDFYIETGELAISTPKQNHFWIAQLELRFDYFIGDMDVDVDGVDYYGRHIKIHRHIHTEEAVNDFKDWIRFNNNFDSYSIRFKGTGKFRMTHMIGKVYRQSGKIGIYRGYDSLQTYRDRLGNTDVVHHYIKNYDNLRETLLT